MGFLFSRPYYYYDRHPMYYGPGLFGPSYSPREQQGYSPQEQQQQQQQAYSPQGYDGSGFKKTRKQKSKRKGRSLKQSGGKQSGGTFDKKVLILCHPEKVTGSFKPLSLKNHWFNYHIKELFEEYNLTGTPLFETVDRYSGGTYTADAFSQEFISKHQNEYDLVLVPDCAGPWYKLQNPGESNDIRVIGRPYSEDEINTNLETLISLSLNLTTLVKQNGIIAFAKFLHKTPCIINGQDYDTFAEALNIILLENGFDSQIKSDDGIGTTVIAVKITE